MKKLLVTLTATLVCVAAFGQGKVALANNSLHMVYFAPAADQTATFGMAPADQSLTGFATAAGTLPSGVKLVAELWAGTSSSALSLQGSTYVGATVAGTIPVSNVILNGIAPGPGVYFQVQIHGSDAASYAVAKAGSNLYYGESGIYQVTASSTPAYTSLVSSSSTWAADVGTYAVPLSTGILANSKGSIEIGMNLVPEPTSLALLGLGAAAMMIFRRRE